MLSLGHKLSKKYATNGIIDSDISTHMHIFLIISSILHYTTLP